MSIFTESEKEPRAFKVIAYDENDELKAEYMFSELQDFIYYGEEAENLDSSLPILKENFDSGLNP